jgi:hypothetical protein
MEGPQIETAPYRHRVSTSLSLAGGIPWFGRSEPKGEILPTGKGGPNWSKPQYEKSMKKKYGKMMMAKWPPVETPLDGTDFRPGTGYIPWNAITSDQGQQFVGQWFQTMCGS